MSGLHLIRNLYPDPRMRTIPSKLTCTGCKLVSSTSAFDPASGTYPGLTLEATRDGDNWAEASIQLPANARLVLACRFNGAEASNGQSMAIWTADGKAFLAYTARETTNLSKEFTVPAEGKVKVTFRAAKTSGGRISVFNVFIGSLDDYRILQEIGTNGFIAWDLMPDPRG